jgi:hypothetical protein
VRIRDGRDIYDTPSFYSLDTPAALLLHTAFVHILPPRALERLTFGLFLAACLHSRLLFALSSVLEVFATRERVGFLILGWLGWLGWLAVRGVLRGAGADGRHHSDEHDLEAKRHS